MIKKLTKVGNSHAIVLDKAIMELAGLTEDSEVQITVTGSCIHVTSANVGIGEQRTLAHTREIRRRYGEALKRLAE